MNRCQCEKAKSSKFLDLDWNHCKFGFGFGIEWMNKDYWGEDSR